MDKTRRNEWAITIMVLGLSINTIGITATVATDSLWLPIPLMLLGIGLILYSIVLQGGARRGPDAPQGGSDGTA